MNFRTAYEDNELIALVKRRDHHAFKFLYDKYSPALYSVILQIVHNREIANKAFQDTFIFIWQRIDRYDPDKERLFTWILKLARYAAIEEVRTELHNHHTGEIGAAGNDTLHQASHSETDECGLKKMIKKLNEENMALLDFCYFKNLTDDQIAKALNIPTETVKIKIKIALSELRTMLT